MLKVNGYSITFSIKRVELCKEVNEEIITKYHEKIEISWNYNFKQGNCKKIY